MFKFKLSSFCLALISLAVSHIYSQDYICSHTLWLFALVVRSTCTSVFLLTNCKLAESKNF